MTFSVRSAVLVGIESQAVTVTATLLPGRPLAILGLPETRETRVWVKSALAQVGLPHEGVAVEVFPDVNWSVSGLDLPIALAIAGLHGKVRWLGPDAIVVGELSLDGRVQQSRGVVAHARAAGKCPLVVPYASAADASAFDAQVFACATLEAAIDGACELYKPRALEIGPSDGEIGEVPHASTRRALEIAAAGGHALLLVGPPGVGKTMAARRMCGILPRMTAAEAAEVLTIHDAAGLRPAHCSVSRPFRAPHHTVSELGLTGGGSTPRPGEATLAHHGVLFLDELPEFRRATIGVLAHVLRNGEARIARGDGRLVFPAAPLLVGAANGCGCGYRGAEHRTCGCTPERLASWRKYSEAYEALFAMRVVLPEGGGSAGHESSAMVRERVYQARRRIASGEIPTIHVEAQRMLDAAVVGSSRVDLQACKLEYSIVSPK